MDTQVIALIATTPRYSYLETISLPSIAKQRRKPDAIVLVSDTESISAEQIDPIKTSFGDLPLHVLKNKNAKGAAGTWNTGISFINKNYKDSFVAILDDDDYWHSDHLQVCTESAHRENSDIVISGIRVQKSTKTLSVNIPTNLSVNDFFVGNPGWQGSNTFVRTSVISAIGGFTDGMISSNDRDLAIRLLSKQQYKISYTGCATVTWNCGHDATALSSPGSIQKKKGCAQFLQLHEHRMTEHQIKQYFIRTSELFSISEQEIRTEMAGLK